MSDPIVLSYYDTLLRQSDLRLLDPPNWLNDHLIGFCFQYYDYELFKDHAAKFGFVDPDIAQFVKMSAVEELDIFLSSMDLGNREMVFLPVNDNSSVSRVGGNHWSLLVYRKESSEFRHYDSSSNFNRRAAELTARKLAQYLKIEKVNFNAETSGSPQQRNSYDCGLYVVCTAEHIGRQATGVSTSGERLTEVVTAERVNRKRVELKKLINELAAANK